jgi:hypothetical protein
LRITMMLLLEAILSEFGQRPALRVPGRWIHPEVEPITLR